MRSPVVTEAALKMLTISTLHLLLNCIGPLKDSVGSVGQPFTQTLTTSQKLDCVNTLPRGSNGL